MDQLVQQDPSRTPARPWGIGGRASKGEGGGRRRHRMGRVGGPEAEVAGLEAVVELDVEADPVLREQPLRPAQYPELLPREPTAREGLSRDASVWWEVDEEPGVCVCVCARGEQIRQRSVLLRWGVQFGKKGTASI